MSTQPLITLDLAARSLAYTSAAMTLRDDAMALSALVSAIETPEQNEAAVAAVAEQRRIEKLFESARVEAKKPALQECREIDSKASDFISPLTVEISRVGKLMGDYAALLEAKKRDEELARRKDIDELERQKRAEAAAATTHEQREAVIEKYDRFAASVPAPTPIELPKGQSAREDWEIVEVDLHALYATAPHCVKMEVNTVALKELLKRREGKVAGVVARPITKVNVRPAREARPLELTGGAA